VGWVPCLIVGERLAQARCGYDGFEIQQRSGVSGLECGLTLPHETDSDSPDGVTSLEGYAAGGESYRETSETPK
jgi:hypothetical protein